MLKNLGLLLFLLLAIAQMKINAEELSSEDGFLSPLQPLNFQIIDNANFNKNLNKKNNVHELIEFQSPVKSQEARGTCSIFSTTALLEAMLNRAGHGLYDLSEEWLEYIATIGKTTDGSNSYYNIPLLKKYGSVEESTWPYIGVDWTKSSHPLKEKRCGHVVKNKTACLLGHRDHALLLKTDEELQIEGTEAYDPEFYVIRKEARYFKSNLISKLSSAGYSSVYYTEDVKKYLNRGIQVTLGIQVHYGAWAHRLADSYGISRDAEQFANGIVSYPEYGSLDREISSHSDKQAGHEVLLVGYDDERIVTSKLKMSDGTIKEFTYKGVYYFKNSWGTYPFGTDFEIDGVNYPGYGMITQKYAHEFGTFNIW